MSTYAGTYDVVYPGGPLSGAQILPQIIVEAAFSPVAPVGVPGTFILDSVTQGILDTDILGQADVWTDISVFVHAFTVTRPSTRVSQGVFYVAQAGGATITLDNSDARFDPDNLAGPYVSGGVTQVRPMVPVRIRAAFQGVTYGLFMGYADSWQDANVSYSAGYEETVLSATDGFKVLAGQVLAPIAAAGAGELSGARVTRILNSAGWSTGYRQVAAGDSGMQATTYGDTVLNLLQLTTASELGELYVNGSGTLVFRDRQAILRETRSNTPQAVFGDLPGTAHAAGTELAYAVVGRADDDTTLANDVQITRAGGALQEVQDAASITTYLFPRTFSATGLLLQSDPEALSYARWALYVSKGSEDRIESLAVDPQADPVSLFPQVLGREYGDRIQVWRRPPGMAALTRDCFIRGIAHSFDAATGAWATTWTLQDALRYGSFLVLDHPVLGVLNSNALAF